MPNDLWTNSKDPYMACHHGGTRHPLYHQCDICPNNDWCETGVLEMLRRQDDKFIEERIKKGIENPKKYKIDEFGHYSVDEKFIRQERKEIQKNLNQKVLDAYQEDLKNSKTFGDKINAFFKALKLSWTEAKKIHYKK